MQNTEQRMIDFIEWSSENIGEKTGGWYSPYLKKLGMYLKLFNFQSTNSLKDNFFEYSTYESFSSIYKQLFQETDDNISEIIKGKTKRYPKESVLLIKDFFEAYAQYTYDMGERSKPDNYGGIPSIGAMCRAYLRFLYYKENPQLTYPKKNSNIKSRGGKVDDSINYWIYAAGEHSEHWDNFYESGIMALGWDYLGNLEKYQTREDIESKMIDYRDDDITPKNDSKAVWDFLKEIQTGDTVYVKQGTKKIIGKGTVTDDYYFDLEANVFKHRRKVDWLNKGEWALDEALPQKTLTKINSQTDWIEFVDRLINEEELPDEKSKIINQFEVWLSEQKLSSGELLNEKTVRVKINALIAAEKETDIDIFGEKDVTILEDVADEYIKNNQNNKYKGVTKSAFDYYIKYIDSRPVIKEENDSYNKKDFLKEVFISENDYDHLYSVLQNKKNIILKGAPGVGKTFMADRLAYSVMGEKDETRIQFVQFHQSYSYEDFIEGFRPKEDGEGFERKTGPFVKFARKASEDLDRDYFFIIDEINRGNMSKIFGELMMLIEMDKRGKAVNLLYSSESFSVPENLYIIGMMNTADRSLALLDYALRRRFAFIDIKPAFNSVGFNEFIEEVDEKGKLANTIKIINELNSEIRNDLGKGFEIGHSYFLDSAYKVNVHKRLNEVIKYEIGPQLLEYWFDDQPKAEEWIDRMLWSVNYDS